MCIKSDFEEIILKLATYGQRENGLSVVIKILSPMDCLSLPGAIYIWWNMKKMYIKSDFKAIFFKPATNGQSDKGFLLTSTFVPKGLSAPALGLYTCIKALKIYQDQVSGERLQDHWSSGYISFQKAQGTVGISGNSVYVGIPRQASRDISPKYLALIQPSGSGSG